jgi:hypothetical protein
MGRNTHVRSHRYIPKQKKKPKSIYNWASLIRNNKAVVSFQKAEPVMKVVVLQGCLICIPWLYIFMLR